MIKTTILVLTVLAVSNATLGVSVDISDTGAANSFACMSKASYPEATIGVSSSPTQVMVDTTGVANLNKAKNAFTKVSISFFSCRGRNPVQQVD
mgnify:CR=1 FL=1|jgi:hypothetical protein